MHFNKLQQQDQIQNTNVAISLSCNEKDTVKITPTTNTLGTDRFTGSGVSCTSSTDSGVHISDTEAPASATAIASTPPSPSPSPTNPLRVQFHKNSNNSSNIDKNIEDNSIAVREDDVQGAKIARIFDNKFKKEQQLMNSSGNESNYNHQKAIQVENVINNSHQATQSNDEVTELTNTSSRREGATSTPHNEYNDPVRAASPAPSSVISSTASSDYVPPYRQHHFSRSPAVSIRSIDSSVIDSDSDSDLNGAAEGVHENYVIKKLGTQVSYPPKHPDIPKINNGLQVVNHQITPNGMGPNGQATPSPLAVLSAMGDNLNRLTSPAYMGQVASASNMPQIAVSASKDITIGDKHFYEGPVTIQQFLIDSRDKWKDSNGKDNPIFQDGSGDTSNNAKDINSSPTALSGNSYAKLLKSKKYIIPGVLVVLALVILAIVLGIETANDSKSKNVLGNSEESRKNIPINSTIDTISDPEVIEDVECVEGQLCLVQRDMWRAHAQSAKLNPQTLPLHRVVIAHTASEPCDSLLTCRDRVRVIQEFHMNSFGWDDIGYNFLVSSEGRVYVGRGWDDVGAHTKGYNYDSVGIAFIGTYTTTKPTEAQLNACRLLIEEGVRLKKLVPTYNLYGARQLGATESPGDALYRIIRNWDHWSPKI